MILLYYEKYLMFTECSVLRGMLAHQLLKHVIIEGAWSSHPSSRTNHTSDTMYVPFSRQHKHVPFPSLSPTNVLCDRGQKVTRKVVFRYHGGVT